MLARMEGREVLARDGGRGCWQGMEGEDGGKGEDVSKGWRERMEKEDGGKG